MKLSYILITVLVCSAAATASAQTWVEGKYLVRDGYVPTTDMPVPQPSWEKISERRIQKGNNVDRVEDLDGPNKGRVYWMVNSVVVNLFKDSQASVTQNLAGDVIEEVGASDISWTKGMQPLKTLRQGENKILVYDKAGKDDPTSPYVQRVWVDEATSKLLAEVSGKYVTILVQESDARDLKPTPEVLAAIKESDVALKKMNAMGAMPPPPRK